MGQRWSDGGYSADVLIYLLIDGKRFDVAQIGGGKLILREPAEIPPFTDATLVLSIDGREEVRQVFLSGGAEIDQRPIAYQTVS